MNKKTSLAVVSIILAFLAATCVTATSFTPDTPLFRLRMEKASNKMHFSPDKMNEFAYNAENGSVLTCEITQQYAVPLEEPTKSTCVGFTCETCYSTCVNTCSSTCVNTCHTCVSTCWETCVNTCHTCCSTCSYTCYSTCSYTCWESCNIC